MERFVFRILDIGGKHTLYHVRMTTNLKKPCNGI